MPAGECVLLTKLSDIQSADTVCITPFQDCLEGYSGDLFEDFLRPYFIGKFPPVRVGNIFRIPSANISSAGKVIDFKVTSMTAMTGNNENGSPNRKLNNNELSHGIVGPETEIIFSAPPLDRREDPSQNEIGYSDIGGCRKQLDQIRELIELPLKHPEVFKALGIPPPKG